MVRTYTSINTLNSPNPEVEGTDDKNEWNEEDTSYLTCVLKMLEDVVGKLESFCRQEEFVMDRLKELETKLNELIDKEQGSMEEIMMTLTGEHQADKPVVSSGTVEVIGVTDSCGKSKQTDLINVSADKEVKFSSVFPQFVRDTEGYILLPIDNKNSEEFSHKKCENEVDNTDTKRDIKKIYTNEDIGLILDDVLTSAIDQTIVRKNKEELKEQVFIADKIYEVQGKISSAYRLRDLTKPNMKSGSLFLDTVRNTDKDNQISEEIDFVDEKLIINKEIKYIKYKIDELLRLIRQEDASIQDSPSTMDSVSSNEMPKESFSDFSFQEPHSSIDKTLDKNALSEKPVRSLENLLYRFSSGIIKEKIKSQYIIEQKPQAEIPSYSKSDNLNSLFCGIPINFNVDVKNSNESILDQNFINKKIKPASQIEKHFLRNEKTININNKNFNSYNQISKDEDLMKTHFISSENNEYFPKKYEGQDGSVLDEEKVKGSVASTKTDLVRTVPKESLSKDNNSTNILPSKGSPSRKEKKTPLQEVQISNNINQNKNINLGMRCKHRKKERIPDLSVCDGLEDVTTSTSLLNSAPSKSAATARKDRLEVDIKENLLSNNIRGKLCTKDLVSINSFNSTYESAVDELETVIAVENNTFVDSSKNIIMQLAEEKHR